MPTQAWAIHVGSAHWQSMVFTVLTLSQLGHVLAIRSERESLFSQGLLSNPMLVGALLLTFALQMAVLYLPGLNPIFKTAPLSLGELAACLALSSLVFVGVAIEKWLVRRGKLYKGAARSDPMRRSRVAGEVRAWLEGLLSRPPPGIAVTPRSATRPGPCRKTLSIRLARCGSKVPPRLERGCRIRADVQSRPVQPPLAPWRLFSCPAQIFYRGRRRQTRGSGHPVGRARLHRGRTRWGRARGGTVDRAAGAGLLAG